MRLCCSFRIAFHGGFFDITTVFPDDVRAVNVRREVADPEVSEVDGSYCGGDSIESSESMADIDGIES